MRTGNLNIGARRLLNAIGQAGSSAATVRRATTSFPVPTVIAIGSPSPVTERGLQRLGHDRMETRLAEVLTKIVEAAAKPGVMSLAGQAMEKKMSKALGIYFRAVGRALTPRLKKLAKKDNAETARHEALLLSNQVIRRYSHTLLHILASHIMEAMNKADKQTVMHEAEPDVSLDATADKLGLSGQEAADYAAEEAAKQVQGINATTAQRYADAVATAIEDELGVSGLSQLLREITDDMSTSRAEAIATTEIGDAFGEAALRKLKREDIAGKQLIPSPDACEICMSIVEAGPVPVDEPFVDDDGEEYDRSPIHVRCRCATVGARLTADEEE